MIYLLEKVTILLNIIVIMDRIRYSYIRYGRIPAFSKPRRIIKYVTLTVVIRFDKLQPLGVFAFDIIILTDCILFLC